MAQIDSDQAASRHNSDMSEFRSEMQQHKSQIQQQYTSLQNELKQLSDAVSTVSTFGARLTAIENQHAQLMSAITAEITAKKGV